MSLTKTAKAEPQTPLAPRTEGIAQKNGVSFRFRAVIHGRRGAMRVDIADVRWSNVRLGYGAAHDIAQGRAFGLRLRQVKKIGRVPVTGQFADRFRAALRRVLLRFKDEKRGSFAQEQSRAIQVERTTAVEGRGLEDHPDVPALISTAALEERCRGCVEALSIFVEAYGAEAGNLALRSVATGGVFIGGGIAPKILPALTDGRLLRAFQDKAPYRDMLVDIPVHVVLNADAGRTYASNPLRSRSRAVACASPKSK